MTAIDASVGTGNVRPETKLSAARTARPVRAARLTRATPEKLTLTRRRFGKVFAYFDSDGVRIREIATIERLNALAIPPAYRNVRLAADPGMHLQAVGTDDAGRAQYRYHPDWEKVRERRKLARLRQLIQSLPKLRAAIARDVALNDFSERRALACAAAIIDRCHIRVGNETYARTNNSYGASTLLKRHVSITGKTIALSFRGKSGKDVDCSCEDAALARALTGIMALAGRRLLQFRREDGTIGAVRAEQVNAYLRATTGLSISAKDLRMLAANAAAAELLLAADAVSCEKGAKRQLADIMKAISERLVNTPAVVRKSYVHEIVVQSFAKGTLQARYAKARARKGCTRIEATLLALAT